MRAPNGVLAGRSILIVEDEPLIALDIHDCCRVWHLFQNRWYEGKQTHQVSAALEEIPVFLREGAVLPLAFHRDTRLGATMPSDIAAPAISVLLIAGLEEGAQVRDGGVEIELSGGVVRVRAQRAFSRTLKLAFADPPSRLELNGAPRPLSTLDLSGVPLAMFDLQATS